ncbi:transcriptional regulator [Microlunatus sp. GCM10028923]|uniref:transcriptional regulator n=1 Tax=Microlunatus sp. GCM10028923 TaxID=3273400 RepID=UPI00362373DB
MTTADVLTLHAVRLLGFAPAERVAARYARPVAETERELAELAGHGWVSHSAFGGDGGWSLTEAGKTECERRLAAELDQAGARPLVDRVHRDFLPYNRSVGELCTAWQLATLGMADPEVDLETTVAGLGPAAEALAGFERELVPALDRFGGYHRRFATSLFRVADDPAWLAGTDRDSCHRVWFEFHEDLIATLGIDRTG